jgi:cytochrome oxidase assembly protein ShyY1
MFFQELDFVSLLLPTNAPNPPVCLALKLLKGYFVITPLEIPSNGQTILVNRGWIPRTFISSENQRQYSRPQGPTSILAVRTKGDTPRFLVPEHDAKLRRLFWMDLDTMSKWTRNVSSSSSSSSSSSTTPSPPIPLYVQVQSKEEEEENKRLISKGNRDFPVRPSSSTVGDFVTTPAIHAGYAVTWFGLAGAGVVMTRKLITRGRG